MATITNENYDQLHYSKINLKESIMISVYLSAPYKSACMNNIDVARYEVCYADLRISLRNALQRRK